MSVVVLAALALRFAYREGPPAGHTGGFGEPTCQACHDYNPLNDSLGSLQLLGLPAHLTPDSTYRLTVQLSRAELAVGGFQLAARFADGRQAGVFHSTDNRTTSVLGADGTTYLEHTRAGTDARQPDTLRWQFDWRSPAAAAGDSIAFHTAGNASNNDNSEFGDFIYSRTDYIR